MEDRPIARRSRRPRRRRSPPPPASSKFASRFTSSSSSSAGAKQNKKINFANFDDALDKNSGHAKRTIPTGGAKTSELKYFKKLCVTADRKGISKSQSVQAQDPNNIRMSFSDQVEKETPSGCIHSFSPYKEQLHEEPSCSGRYDTPTYKLHKGSTYPPLKITPLAQEPLILSPEASRYTNSESENGRVFSNKRRNLIKLAARTLSVGVDDFFQKRSEFLGELIQRLGTKQQPKTKKSITSSQLETPREKYNHLGHKLMLENTTHLASNLPSLPSIEKDLEPNINLGWSIDEVKSSELYPDFGTGFHANTAHDSTNYQLPSSPCYDLVPYSCGNDDPDQSLVPYTCFQSPVEKFNAELMSWDVKEEEEEHSHLPLALYNPSHLYNEAEELGGDMFFDSTPRENILVLESDASYDFERENFSHIPEGDFSFNDQSLVLVKADSEHRIMGFSCDLPLLDPPYSPDGSNLCGYNKESYDFFS